MQIFQILLKNSGKFYTHNLADKFDKKIIIFTIKKYKRKYF